MLDQARQEAAIPQREASGGLYSLGGVLLAVGLYSALHVAARLIASANLGEDDPLDAILTQTLALGYLPGQPPLYDWALWLLERVTGPGALHFQVLKYGLLTATCGFIFLAARRLMKGDVFWAFVSVEALALIYQISWRFHEGFTHAVGAMCAVAATFWALTRLIERRRPGDYAVFGLCAGLGLLTVATYWVYVSALIAAGLLQPSIRRVLAAPAMGLAASLAVLVATPHYLWLAQTPEGLSAMLPALASQDTGDHLRLALAGIRRAFTEPLMYLAPLVFILPLFFPGWLRAAWRHMTLRAERGAEPDLEQLILHQTLICVGALIAGAVIFGIHSYPVHALMPMFLISAIWLTAQARNALPDNGQIRRFAIMAVSVAVFAFFARAANMYVLEPVCNICRWGVPYEELAQDMRRQGFDGGRIVVIDSELGGNLRRFFPEARMELTGRRQYAPAGAHDGRGKTALVWAEGDTREAASRFGAAVPDGKRPADAARIEIPWRGHLWKPDGYRMSVWRLMILH